MLRPTRTMPAPATSHCIASLATALLSTLAACTLIHTAAADIEAEITTGAGTIRVDLRHDLTPRTVANFITLAEGSRPWVDSLNGTVRETPFFPGLQFTKIPDGAGGELTAAGTRSGDAKDDPGYSFPDEINPSLTHQPYVIAMANRGPNTNGSLFCFTGATAVPSRDGFHSVFGAATDSTSRSVIPS